MGFVGNVGNVGDRQIFKCLTSFMSTNSQIPIESKNQKKTPIKYYQNNHFTCRAKSSSSASPDDHPAVGRVPSLAATLWPSHKHLKASELLTAGKHWEPPFSFGNLPGEAGH